jgi:hypothetical protein
MSHTSSSQYADEAVEVRAICNFGKGKAQSGKHTDGLERWSGRRLAQQALEEIHSDMQMICTLLESYIGLPSDIRTR